MNRMRPDASAARPATSPFVGCFTTRGKHYIYDTNTSTILQVDPPVFHRVSLSVNDRANSQQHLDYPETQRLRALGFLSTARPSRVSAPCLPCIERRLDSELGHAVLELTQDCNHSCVYCPYSPLEPTRRLSTQARMGWATAKAGMDLLLRHSRNSDRIALGFYGGEPLIEWDLMRRCIDYMSIDSRAHLSLTTNATLVTSDIADTLSQAGVAVHISLDGPQQIHDAGRKLRGTSDSAYDATLRGLANLREAYGNMARQCLYINAVTGPWTDLRALRSFFSTSPPPEIADLNYRLSGASHSCIEEVSKRITQSCPPTSASPSPPLGERDRAGSAMKEEWRSTLSKPGAEPNAPDTLFLRKMFERPLLQFHKRPLGRLGSNLGPMGMCTPGLRKLYIDVAGNLLPCERVHESFTIGHVSAGRVDARRAQDLLRLISTHFNRRCVNCIFCRVCSGCASSYSDSSGRITEDSISLHCSQSASTCRRVIGEYASILDQNPNCFDYMDQIVVS